MVEAEQSPPAGPLELVRRFVNSADIEAGQDEFADLAGWRTWAERNGFDAPGSSGTADLGHLVDLREALRDALQANHDRARMPPAAAAELTRAAEWAAIRLRFAPEGSLLASEAPGMRAVAAAVLARVVPAMADGTWARLKACALHDSCEWAFYDWSKNSSGTWCDMAVCGNRAKARAYRERRRGATA
jgi:predicted RNA-binding Zn ribbon-like protein